MISIFGAWQLNKKPLSPTTIQQVIEETAWWNPDKQGHYHEKEIFLGHQLLATKPQQQQEVQPYQDTLAQLQIIADIRLDNRQELQELLGIADKQLPDYQLILTAYKRYGVACVKYLIGAFAFVIWDEKEQQLFCARDQMGVKSFNYYYRNQLFAFGTQKKSILAIEGVDKTANWRTILNKISKFEITPNSTEYQHIQLLAPGHYLIVKQSGIQLQRYWELDIHQTTTYKNEQDYVEHFRELFQQAIADRLICNQLAGTHLSGGLDSSGITAVADAISKKSGQPLHTFAYSVPRDFNDADKMDRVEENLLAFDVLDHCQLPHFHNVYTPIERSFRTIIEQEIQACDGLAQSNNVNTEYEIQAAAQAQGVDVLLSGFPGDELVTSFARPYYLEYLERGQLGAYFYKTANSRQGYKDKVKNLLAAKATSWFPNKAKQLREWHINRREKDRFYSGHSWVVNKDYFNSHPELAGALEKQITRLVPSATSLKESQRNHVCREHTSRRMESETLAGLRFKVEYRYPMADIRLLQYVLSIPVEQKINKTTNRLLFRQGMEGYLPDSIRLRDMKYKGSLKTTHLLHTKHPKENSKLELWKNIQEQQAAPFLNTKLVGKYMNGRRSPFGLYNWMLLGQLGVEGKLKF